MADQFVTYPAVVGGGGGGGGVTWNKDSFPVVNGTAVYTLSFTPFDSQTLEAFVNGVYQSDFTLLANVVTFGFVPLAGPVEFIYRKT